MVGLPLLAVQSDLIDGLNSCLNPLISLSVLTFEIETHLLPAEPHRAVGLVNHERCCPRTEERRGMAGLAAVIVLQIAQMHDVLQAKVAQD